MSSETARYVRQLRAHLRLGDELEAEFLREIEGHVEDRVAALTASGVSATRAQHLALQGFGRPQTLAHLMRQVHQTATWAEALLGAVPYALIASLLAFHLWTLPWMTVSVAGIVAIVTLYGLWLGRPAWFYPWAGAALMLPVFAGYAAYAVLDTQLPGLAAGTSTAWEKLGIAGAGLYFPVGFVVVAASVLVAVRRDWLDASVLLSPLPLALVFVIALHRSGGLLTPDGSLGGIAPLLAGVSLCAAAAMCFFLRTSTRTLRVATLVVSALLLLSTATLLADPSGGLIALGSRCVMLLAFLLSPALVARHA